VGLHWLVYWMFAAVSTLTGGAGVRSPNVLLVLSMLGIVPCRMDMSKVSNGDWQSVRGTNGEPWVGFLSTCVMSLILAKMWSMDDVVGIVMWLGTR